MTLNQALAIINSRRDGGEGGIYHLVCGFEPLHLSTFFRAHLEHRRPDGKDLEVRHGVFGDLRGNIDRAAQSPAVAAAVVMEWSDADPRLGLRSSGGWSNDVKTDLLENVPKSFVRLETAIGKLGARMPVAVAAPSLQLPPIGSTIRAQSSSLELELEQQLAVFLLRVSRMPGVRVVQRQRGEEDAKMELLAGFPYAVHFADALANSLPSATFSASTVSQRKGLITDLAWKPCGRESWAK